MENNNIDPNQMALLNALADDPDTIPYRKRLNRVTGSVTATILLQQILFRAKGKGFKPFFKFRAPCEHSWYKGGDSWTEELGFSLAEFDTALKKIGTKVTKGMSKAKAYRGTTIEHLVIYWTDASRITWYHVNLNLLGKLIIPIYLEDEETEDTDKSGKSIYLSSENPETTPESDTEKGGKEPPADYLSDVLARAQSPNQAGIASPDQDTDQWLQYRDAALRTYQELTGLYPDTRVGKPAIVELAGGIGFDPECWRHSIKSCLLAGVKPTNIACIIDTYRAGGNYRDLHHKPPAQSNGNGWGDGDFTPAEFEPPPELQPHEILWNRARADLRTSMPAPVYEAHFARARATGRDDGVLRIEAANPQSAEWIRERLGAQVLAAVRGVDESVTAVEVGT